MRMTPLIAAALLFSVSGILAQVDSEGWGPYEGHMAWELGESRCQEKNMRLPTLEELEKKSQGGIPSSWSELDDGTGYAYWTSQKVMGHHRAFYVRVHNATHSTEETAQPFRVRCHKR